MKKKNKNDIFYALYFTRMTMEQLTHDNKFGKTAQDVIDIIDDISNRYIKVELDKFVKDYVLNEDNQ